MPFPNIQTFDREFADKIDDTYSHAFQDTLPDLLTFIAKQTQVQSILVSYKKSLSEERTTAFSSPTPLNGQELLAHLEQESAKTTRHRRPFETDYAGQKLVGITMWAGSGQKEYVGLLGAVCADSFSQHQINLLEQAASRLDHHLFTSIRKFERIEIIKTIFSVVNEGELREALSKTLQLLMALNRSLLGVLIYYKSHETEKADQHFVNVIASGDIDSEYLSRELNKEELGYNMINYPPDRITDSDDVARLFKMEKGLDCQCFNIVPRGYEQVVGKLVLVDNKNLSTLNHDITTLVTRAIGYRIYDWHERKRDLSRSLAPDMVDIFIDHSELFEQLFRQPHKQTIAMVFVDLSGFTDLTNDLDEPGLVIEIVKSWVVRERERIIRHGGYFDKEVGDGVISLFGPPFYGIPIEEFVGQHGNFENFIKENSKPYNYAYAALEYAQDCQQAVQAFSRELSKKYQFPDLELKVTIGIQVGAVAVGDTTGRDGVLTAIGAAMNLAARLQAQAAKPGEVCIGSECRLLLDEYGKQNLLKELPFRFYEDKAELKGFGVVTFYKVEFKSDDC